MTELGRRGEITEEGEGTLLVDAACSIIIGTQIIVSYLWGWLGFGAGLIFYGALFWIFGC